MQDKNLMPDWKCFACSDSGFVNDNPFFVKAQHSPKNNLAIRHICTRRECKEGQAYLNAHSTGESQRKEWAIKHGGTPTTWEYQLSFAVVPAFTCEELHDQYWNYWREQCRKRQKQGKPPQLAVVEQELIALSMNF